MTGRAPLALAVALGACNAQAPNLGFGSASEWPRSSSYPGVGAGRIFLTNNQEDTVSLFDLGQVGQPGFAELARVPVGLDPVVLEGPHEASIDPTSAFYYVNLTNYVAGGGGGPRGPWGTGLVDGYVAKYRSADNQLVAAAEVDPSPGNSAVSLDGKTLYVSHYDFATILQVAAQGGSEDQMATRFFAIDTATMKTQATAPMCPGAHGLRLSPDGTRAYITCIADKIAVVDLTQSTYPAQYVFLASDPGTVIVPKYEPYALAVSPVTGEVWVSCRGNQQVRVISPATMTVDLSRVIGVGGQPLFGDFNQDGSLFYIATQLSDSVTVIETATGRVLRQFAFPQGACSSVHQFKFTPDYRYGLVACEGDHGKIPGSLVVFDMQNGESFVTAVPLGIFTDFVGILKGSSS